MGEPQGAPTPTPPLCLFLPSAAIKHENVSPGCTEAIPTCVRVLSKSPASQQPPDRTSSPQVQRLQLPISEKPEGGPPTPALAAAAAAARPSKVGQNPRRPPRLRPHVCFCSCVNKRRNNTGGKINWGRLERRRAAAATATTRRTKKGKRSRCTQKCVGRSQNNSKIDDKHTHTGTGTGTGAGALTLGMCACATKSGASQLLECKFSACTRERYTSTPNSDVSSGSHLGGTVARQTPPKTPIKMSAGVHDPPPPRSWVPIVFHLRCGLGILDILTPLRAASKNRWTGRIRT